MPVLSPMDEQFVHQIPEPLPHVVTPSEHWRESLSSSSIPGTAWATW